MPVSEEHEEFIHCSCQNVFVLVRLALQKSCGICFQDGKKTLRIPKSYQKITKPYAGICKVPSCECKGALPGFVFAPR